MSDSETAMSVLRETIGEFNKEIVETNAVIDWRRDNSWNTLEDMLGIYTVDEKPLGIMSAMQDHATLACIDVISRDISKLDLHLYERRPDGGKRKVDPNQHWFAGMLAMEPNSEHSWAEFFQMATIHLVLANNVFLAKDMARNGDLRELIPLIPGRCEINHLPDTYEKYLWVARGTLFEEAMLKNLGSWLREDQYIHVRKRIVDGLHGLPTLAAGAPSISLSKAITEYQKRLYRNDGQARVSVQQDANMQPLSDEAFQRLKQEVRTAARKMMQDGEAMLLEPGYKAVMLAMSAADMKVAEMHDATISQVARVFGVPPHKIGHIKDEKYSNLEVVERTYAHDVLIPIAKAFEDALARNLLSPRERMRYFLRFDRKQMEIVDYKQRAEVMKIMMQHGAVTIDEMREEFGMNPLPNGAGQVRMSQSTMSLLAGDSNEVLLPAGSQGPDPEGDVDAEPMGDKHLKVVK